MAAESTSAPEAPGSIEALKQVRAAETGADERVKVAKGAAEEAIRRLSEEAVAAIKAAQAAADSERAAKVGRAREDADRAAAAIVAEGERAAEVAARSEGKRPADRRDEILRTVLAGFWTD
jgi:vacuolar-type H+-ATPase subunit H